MSITIEEYGTEIINILEKKNPELEFNFNPSVRKNNNVILSGISIRRKDSNVAPMIYINDLYQREVDIEDAVNEVWNIYNNNNMHKFDFIDKINDFDFVKNHLSICISNFEKNKEIADTCPYALFGDFIVYFIIVIDDKPEGRMTIKVHNELMNSWGVNLSDIMEAAFDNIKRNPAQIIPINVMIENILKMHNMSINDMYGIPELPVDQPMYVVTNNSKNNGCIYIAHKDTLLAISKQIGANGFYIIPSSIHELIIVPFTKDDENKDLLLSMVKDVNIESVPESEFLSDNVYYFDANTEELTDANDNKLIFLS